MESSRIVVFAGIPEYADPPAGSGSGTQPNQRADRARPATARGASRPNSCFQLRGGEVGVVVDLHLVECVQIASVELVLTTLCLDLLAQEFTHRRMPLRRPDEVGHHVMYGPRLTLRGALPVVRAEHRQVCQQSVVDGERQPVGFLARRDARVSVHADGFVDHGDSLAGVEVWMNSKNMATASPTRLLQRSPSGSLAICWATKPAASAV